MEDSEVCRCAQLKTWKENQRRKILKTAKKKEKKEVETQRDKAKLGKKVSLHRSRWKRDVNGKEIQKGRNQRKKDIRRAEKEGQTERWKVLWREGIFMSGCRQHSGTPPERSQVWYRVREMRALVFERLLMEQRAQNCSIRLSRKSYSKNEAWNNL